MNRRKAFSLTARAFRLLWKYQPGLPLWTLLHSVLSAVQPYTTIYFSARVLGELAYGRDPGRL
ncbi:MAG TPA: ABC transporter ATP-binding protein, partial [Candidatus Faecousia intestinigallinarum]|nr:ABC transporter ATP-binding protein [Candidatus Faecousia intestinigallinarum]